LLLVSVEEVEMTRDAFVERLCERLAFETGSVQIYDAILAKVDDPSLTRRLEQFRDHEAKHQALLAGYLDQLGVSDRQPPAARLAEAEGRAFLSLVEEANGLPQLLNILLTLELTDETGWELLIDLGRDLGDVQIVRTFAAALRDEKEHLRGVRGLVAQLAKAEATTENNLHKE
jgi:rubrerythrin